MITSLSAQPTPPVGEIIALPCEDVIGADIVANLAGLFRFIAVLLRSSLSPRAMHYAPLCACEHKIVAKLDLGRVRICTQALCHRRYPNRVRLIQVKLISPFLICPIHWAMSVSITAKLLDRPHLNPPTSCGRKVKEMILGDHHASVGLCMCGHRLNEHED